MDKIQFNLANFAPRKQKPAAVPAKNTPALKMPKDTWERRKDDYAERHAQAFAPIAPPPSDSGLPKIKLGLGIKLDDSTRIDLKPSLKKGGGLKIELRKKF